MANPTSAFGWQMPTSTDLVTDLPADFETFGQAVDTSLADLKGGTTGQVLSKASNTDMDFTWVAAGDTNAIQNAIVDAKGDLIAATANDTPARLAVGADGSTLVADSAASTGLSWALSPGFAAGKNKFINGDLYVNQRGFTSTTSNAVYTFDRWITSASDGTSTFSAQTFTAGSAPVAGYELTNYVRVVTTGQTLTSASTIWRQLIEDVRTFAGQTVTVSFWAKANSGTPKIAVGGTQAFGSGGSTAIRLTPAQATLSTLWARYSATIAVPSVSGKTIGTGSALQIEFWLSAGSDFNSRTSSLGIQSNTFEMAGFQIEAGSVATPFQTATGTIQGELAACQRYYQRMTGGKAYSRYAQGPASSSINVNYLFRPFVPMRVAVTSVDYGNLLLDDGGGGSQAVTSLGIDAQTGADVVQLNAGVSSGLTQFRTYNLSNNNNTAGFVGWSAEL